MQGIQNEFPKEVARFSSTFAVLCFEFPLLHSYSQLLILIFFQWKFRAFSSVCTRIGESDLKSTTPRTRYRQPMALECETFVESEARDIHQSSLVEKAISLFMFSPYVCGVYGWRTHLKFAIDSRRKPK
jgi:hypothetical protein